MYDKLYFFLKNIDTDMSRDIFFKYWHDNILNPFELPS